jgi:hypothetical protein
MSEQYEDLMHSMGKTIKRLVNAAEEIGIQMGRINDIAHTKPEPNPARPTDGWLCPAPRQARTGLGWFWNVATHDTTNGHLINVASGTEATEAEATEALEA